MNKEEMTRQTYNKIAKLWSNKRPNEYFWQDELDYLRSLKSGGSLIDVGCGAGRDGAMLHEAGYAYLGVDYSESMVEVASTRHPNLDYQLGDMYDLSSFGTYDVVWAIASILHIEKKNVPEVLNSLVSKISHEGVLVVAMKQDSKGEVIETFDDGSKRLMVYWEESEFRAKLEDAGVEIINTMHKKTDEFHWMTFFARASS